MPNLTTPFLNLKGRDISEDMKKINEWSVSLIDELKTILCNLDSGNVLEAAKIKAQNIDVSQARIKGAQIQSLTADKLTAGTIDAREIIVENIDANQINTGALNTSVVTIKGENKDKDGNGIETQMTGDTLYFKEKYTDDEGVKHEAVRLFIGRDENRDFVFEMRSRDGLHSIKMDSAGNIDITGNIGGASNISVTSDVNIGEILNFRDKDTGTNGGLISISNNRLLIAGLGNRGVMLTTGGNIDLTCSSCTINGKTVLTE